MNEVIFTLEQDHVTILAGLPRGREGRKSDQEVQVQELCERPTCTQRGQKPAPRTGELFNEAPA